MPRSAECIAYVVGERAVYTVDLSLIELGIHEELVAYVADRQDYYAEEGVHVALRDGRTWGVDRLRRTATIGLGRALVHALTGGGPWAVLCVNTQHPLFWLLARESFTAVEALKGRRIGIHALRTGPAASTASCCANTASIRIVTSSASS